MATETQKLIRSVWPLPGGNSRYLHTLDQAIKFVASSEHPTKDKLAGWFMSQYSVGPKTVNGYVQVISKLGVVDVLHNDEIKVSNFGFAVMDAQENEKARLVVEQLMRNYLGFREVLALFGRENRPIHISEIGPSLRWQFPDWTSDSQFQYRTLWLLSLGCLRQTGGSEYQLTKFGEDIAMQFPSHRQNLDGVQESEIVKATTEAAKDYEQLAAADRCTLLVTELTAAATDSSQPERLERAIAEAFEFLGFTVDQLGDSGDTDVLLQANIGARSYSIVVDAKARKLGKLQDLEAYTLRDHRAKNSADYAVVVAGDFAGGKVVSHAEELNIILLPVPVLCDLLELHAQTPLNLVDHRSIFEKAGLISSLPAAMAARADTQHEWAKLITELLALFEQIYSSGLVDGLTSYQLFQMLAVRLQGVRYPVQDVSEALALLANHALAALSVDEHGNYSMAMGKQTLVHALRALADGIEQADSDA